jgi:hypothetical protein
VANSVFGFGNGMYSTGSGFGTQTTMGNQLGPSFSMNPFMTPGSGSSPLQGSQAANWGHSMGMVSDIMSLMGGFSAMGASNQQAGMIQRNADLALQDAQLAANQKAMEVSKFAGQQQEEFASSGVTLAGSPALVMNETVRLGQQEVHQILLNGVNQKYELDNQAYQVQNQGRNQFLGTVASTALKFAAFGV